MFHVKHWGTDGLCGALPAPGGADSGLDRARRLAITRGSLRMAGRNWDSHG